MTWLPQHFRELSLHQVRRGALIVGLVWLASCAIGWIFEPTEFYQSYLSAWLFWLGITLGAMGIVMLHHLLGGEWGQMTRRLGEHAAMTLPLMIVLFLPIAIGTHSLYVWSRPEELAADAGLRHKAPYLNVPFFMLRAAIYGGTWFLLAWYLRGRSLQHDRTGDWATARNLHHVSAAGLPYYFVSMSFAALDWLMSREPHWYSTVFGLLVVCGQGLSGMCFLIVAFSVLFDRPPFRGRVRADHFNDLGNLLLTLVILWSYLDFVQLLVQWMGNKQDEVPWYIQRLSGGWWWIGLCLVVFHFFVPFFVLLMREAKRRAPIMLALCAGLLVLRAVDTFWMTGPSGDDPHPLLHHVLSWMNFVFPLGMGGLWVAMFLWLMEGHPLMAQGGPAPPREPDAPLAGTLAL
jgi:hypothetical protein